MSLVDANRSVISLLSILTRRSFSQAISMNDCKHDWLSKFLNLFKMYFSFENDLSQATCDEDNVSTNLYAKNKFE